MPDTQDDMGIEDYGKQLTRQLGFIARSAASYDAGCKDEAVRIATVLRILLHDTPKSTSLLSLMGVRDRIRLLSTCPDTRRPGDTILHEGLGLFRYADGRGELVPAVGASPIAHFEPVEVYWKKPLYVLDDGAIRPCRRDIVLGAANKDGGAHVDPNLTPEYRRLVEGSVGEWVGLSLVDGQGVREIARGPLMHAHYVCLRDMAYEVLHSPELRALASGRSSHSAAV